MKLNELNDRIANCEICHHASIGRKRPFSLCESCSTAIDQMKDVKSKTFNETIAKWQKKESTVKVEERAS